MSQASASTSAIDPERWLSRFGLSSFRLAQRDVIAAVLAGRDCLCIMPTGGGKSLCYQLPAVAREGLTLVISPLIALMKDQVDSLASLGIRATCINSSLTLPEQHARLQEMAAGRYDLVYVAPERLRNQRFLDAVQGARIQLLAIDEAHCISEWGHDFRPDYARLGRFRQRLGNPQTIALTATATPEVRDDIALMLALNDPQVIISGFARDNLRFEVQEASTNRDKDQRLLEFLRQTPGSGIVYASSRKACETVRQLIADELKRTVGVYHAGLLPDDRRQVQEDFMSDRLQIITATNAFGMGIDKRDLRFVVHYNMPGSLEAYYQEAGRAGRDGQLSRCLLLFAYQDRYIQEFFIDNAYPSREIVEMVYEYLRGLPDDPVEITLEDLKERLALPIGSEGVGACERLLEKAGALERMDSGENKASVRIESDLPTLVDLLPREARVQRRVLRLVEREVGSRRGQRVYFHLQRLAAQAEMDRDAVLRALRELNRLQSFDYVPAFRGRALHVLDRRAPFAQLGIDFQELAQRRKAEYDKLERVISFARARGCRQLQILDYFGDPDRRHCGRCDNCARRGVHRGEPKLAPPAASSPEIVKAVRIALSGIARGQGRFGKNLVAQMLCGSKSAKMAKFHLDRLSTFGLLSQLTQPEVAEVIEAAMAAGLIEQTDVERNRPVLRLTDLGGDVMRSRAELPAGFALAPAVASRLIGRPATPDLANLADPAGAQDAVNISPLDSGLEGELRQWRREMAESCGWPAYRILTNAALRLLVAAKPADVSQLLAIKGIGNVTAAAHGEAILALVGRYRSQATGPAPAAQPDHQHPGRKRAIPEDSQSDPAPDRFYDEPEVRETLDDYGTVELNSLQRPGYDDSAPATSTTAADASGRTLPQPRSRLPQRAQAFEADDARPSFYWTWRLLWDGYTMQQCQQIRGLDADEFVAHLRQARDEQLPVESDWIGDRR